MLLHDYKLVEITATAAGHQRQYVGHRWADVNVDELRQSMRWCYENRDAARALGVRARQDMVEKFSWDEVGRIMRDRILELA